MIIQAGQAETVPSTRASSGCSALSSDPVVGPRPTIALAAALRAAVTGWSGLMVAMVFNHPNNLPRTLVVGSGLWLIP